jgi:small glutamine-rich tetratricopeptide repeat-containing protein alpha
MSSQDQVNFLVAEYLSSLKAKNPGSSDALDTVIQLLQDEFPTCNQSDVDNFKSNSFYPRELGEIVDAGVKSLGLQSFDEASERAKANSKFDAFFDVVVAKGYFQGCEDDSVEYLQRYAKLIKKFQEKSGKTAASKEDLEAQAEEAKTQGNKSINAKNYAEAEGLYSKALELSADGPSSHIYYSNRAAASCHLRKYQEAVDDCLASLQLSPNYVKAYSRLGLSYFFLEQYQEAVEAYERAVELEPNNKSSQDSLQQAKSKLKKSQKASQVSDAPSGPDMASMLNNPALQSAMDKVGGQAGLANLMNNPQMMSMAQQMMKDPTMMQQAMSMLGGGGGGGGMPDLSQMASLMNSAGGPPAANAPSSSSAKKQPFRGFEE